MSTSNGYTGLTGPISQDELSRYSRLRDEARRLDAELDAIRRDLIHRLGEGVPIELGPYRAYVSESLQQRLTCTSLMQILDEAEVEELKERVPPTRCTALHVVLDV